MCMCVRACVCVRVCVCVCVREGGECLARIIFIRHVQVRQFGTLTIYENIHSEVGQKRMYTPHCSFISGKSPAKTTVIIHLIYNTPT